ncbi:MAG: hypothetical protein RL477_2131 [Pseudomonadota bacterium]|jgi:uncharacterized protein YqeY
MLRQDINDALKTAMKAKDARATSTLRLILAALKDRDIASRTEGKGMDGIGEDAILEMLQKMIKQRHDSIDQYRKGNRPDLVQQEEEEIEIIKTFLPRQMSEDEVTAAIDATVKDIGAVSIKDMGKTMSALKERYAGKMDFTKASALVKARLAAG